MYVYAYHTCNLPSQVSECEGNRLDALAFGLDSFLVDDQKEQLGRLQPQMKYSAVLIFQSHMTLLTFMLCRM